MLIESESQKKDRYVKELNEETNKYMKRMKESARRRNLSRRDEHKIREMEIRQDK